MLKLLSFFLVALNIMASQPHGNGLVPGTCPFFAAGGQSNLVAPVVSADEKIKAARVQLIHAYLVGNAKFPQINQGIALYLMAEALDSPFSLTNLFTPASDEETNKVAHAMNQLHKGHNVPLRTIGHPDVERGVRSLALGQIADLYNFEQQYAAECLSRLIKTLAKHRMGKSTYETWFGALRRQVGLDTPLVGIVMADALLASPEIAPIRSALKRFGAELKILMRSKENQVASEKYLADLATFRSSERYDRVRDKASCHLLGLFTSLLQKIDPDLKELEIDDLKQIFAYYSDVKSLSKYEQ